MDYRYLIALFLLLNICSFCNSKEEEEKLFSNPLKIMNCASYLIHKVIKKDTRIALETYQRLGVLTPEGYNNGDIANKDNWYYVREGLWGEHTISLESSTQKDYFLRLSGSNIRLEKYEESANFKIDASFIPTTGVEDYLSLSLRPLRDPKSYVRHYGGVISNMGHKYFDDYDRDATWRVYTDKDIED